MSFGMFGHVKATLNKRLCQRQIFAVVKNISVVEKSLKCGGVSTPYYMCVRFQHSRKQMDLAKLKTNGGQCTAPELKIDDEEVVRRMQNQVYKPTFPLKQLTKSSQIFESIALSSANEQGFGEAIETFKKRDVKRLRVMDFISTAGTYMEPFGVLKNVESYNQLLDLFPKGRYHYKTVFDTLWTRYRPQIDCAVQVLTKLEENGVRPNVDTYDIVHAVFGNDSIPLNKLRRIVFWFDKFDEMYPDPLPKELPLDKQDLFLMAINRMVDETFRVSVTSYQDSDGLEQQITGAEKENLSNFLTEYDLAKPVFVEGPQIMWLRKTRINYYVLKADVDHNLLEDHVLAVCILDDNEGEAELKMWMNELQQNYPKLQQLNFIFNTNSSTDKL